RREPASAEVSFDRLPRLDSTTRSMEGDTIDASLTITAPSTIGGAAVRNASGFVNCSASGPATPSPLFPIELICLFSGTDQAGDPWSARVQFDAEGNFTRFESAKNHVPTFDIIATFEH